MDHIFKGTMKQVAYFIMTAIIICGCSTNEPIDMDDFHKMYGSENTNAGELIEKVSGHQLYFGHQSVGFNILSGVARWEDETGVSINKVESRDFANTGSAALVHFRVGKNGDPKSKIDDFVSLMETVPCDSASVAFFKFCYVDVTEGTNVEEVFDYYKEKMHALKDSFPDCRILLITVPLTSIQKGLKATAKKILGRKISGREDNLKRYAFNQRLLNELAGDFSVFDLAGVEATLPDGSTNTFAYDGKDYPAMPGIYTSDGGHLNDYGAKVVAYNLLAFLSETLK